VLAGGQSLGPLLNLRLAMPAALVDVNRIAGLGTLRAGAGGLEIGALARQRTVELDADVARGWPLVVEALADVGHAAIRNRGTVGGSLAHADPVAELPAVVTALGGAVVARSRRGDRTIPAAEFFAGPFTTTLEPDELVVSVHIEPLPPRAGTAWLELARRHGDFALAGVACVVCLDEGEACASSSIVLAGVGGTPFDAREAAALLDAREPDADLFNAVAESAAASCQPSGDVHASADYRRRLVRVLVGRALELAFERARGAAVVA
jgi:carbon-monoxide dehydrogenase medium subunit